MTLFDNLSDIPDFPESHSDVYSGVIFISNKSKYLKTEVRYPTAVKTNIYNFKSSFMSSRHPEIGKMCRLVLYTERGQCWDYPWDWKLFNLFVFTPRKLENGLVVPGSFTAISQSVEMGRIFNEELLRVQALCQYMDISITECELQEKKLTSLFNLNY